MKRREIQLLKNNDHKDWDDLQWVEEFNEFLTGAAPKTITMGRGHQPKLSAKKAYSIIWYLQEHFPLLPDHIEKCDHCNNLFDSYSTGYWCESRGKHFCDQTCEEYYNRTHKACNRNGCCQS